MHMYVCISGGKQCSFFGEIWRALFSENTRFEIRSFAGDLYSNFYTNFVTKKIHLTNGVPGINDCV